MRSMAGIWLPVLGRHTRGDWGDIRPEDWRANQIALREGERVFSTYTDRHQNRFYIITEADRSATTVLLPGGLLTPT